MNPGTPGDGTTRETTLQPTHHAIEDYGPGESGSVSSAALKQKHVEFKRGDTGISFEKLIVPYLIDATEITITDPFIITLDQVRNLLELLEDLVRAQGGRVQTSVLLRTQRDKDGDEKKDLSQTRYLDRVAASMKATPLRFEYRIESDLHWRTIVANSGWRILLDRGLDIFERVPSDPLQISHRMQEYRKVRPFYVTFLPLDEET
ncbi:MIT C-terminal domain-containing protein [Arthrobacter sp. SAFR-044]